MQTINLVNDEITFIRFKDGDMKAFDIIYNAYSRKLFGFIYKILKTEADTKEVVQEVFIKLWENRQKITSLALFDSYLFTIAHNKSIDTIRKRLREKKYIEYIYSLQISVSENKTLDEFDYQELKQQSDLLIEKLPQRQKEVYKLSRVEHLSYQEIAVRLNISVNTVENHMSKALQILRQGFECNSLAQLLFIFLFL